MNLKRALVYLSCFVCLANFCTATTTVTGHVSTLGTTAVTSSTFVRFWLRGCGGNQPRILGQAAIAPSSGGVFFFDMPVGGGGLVSGTLFSSRDATGALGGDIECGGSTTAVWYGMQLFQSGKGGPEVAVHAKNGATLDISNVVPISTTPVTLAPTGDNTYARLDAINQPFNGSVQIPKLGIGRAPVLNLDVQISAPGTAVASFKNTDPTGFGASFAPGADSNYGISVQNSALTQTVFTEDGLGNATAIGSMNAPAGNFSTINTTGSGFTQTFQTQTAPSNPPTGNMLWYGDSGTNKWACLNHDGSSCAPGGAAFSGISAAPNSNAGTFAATGNSWDFTGTTIFKLRVTAGCTTTVVGDLCYDSTSKMWHIWMNGADNFLVTAPASGSYTDQDCVKLVKTGALFNLADSGGACGGSGTASIIEFTSGTTGASTTVSNWIGLGNVSATEAAQQVPVPRAGTVANLQCRVGIALSSSQAYVLTLRKGAASVGAITSSSQTLTCTLNSTNTSGCSDSTHNFAVAAGDVLDIEVDPSNSPTSTTFRCSVQF